MEADKRYFFEGLFIIALSAAAVLAFLWLAKSGGRDDVLYRIRFAESVSGLALGDPVKFRGVDVGTVKGMRLDPKDPRWVLVDVSLHKDAPVKTDTKATLEVKGLTGTVFVQLSGGAPAAKTLLAATPQGEIPEIPSEKGNLSTILDQLPKVIEKFSVIENRANKVLTDVGDVTQRIKENPSLLLRRPKETREEKKTSR
jgi:phospholipid/cholesterol/gamma-HCH transport system substrate-binding protein